MYDLNGLEIDGFTILRNFVEMHEINQFISQYNSIGNTERKILTAPNNNVLQHKIAKLTEQINHTTTIRLDLQDTKIGYFDTLFYQNKWHQDHEPLKFFKDPFHAINLWIPLVKPNSTMSGIKVIPFSKIPVSAVDYFINNAARRILVENDQTVCFDDSNNGEKQVFDFNIDKIAVIPEINVGDVLLMRGDTIHMSQDNDTRRIAVNIRCFKFNKEKLWHNNRLNTHVRT
jgi:ectoine hydroxylase-related dioxygenase (phytanoyl-CoA dioxygenase family)